MNDAQAIYDGLWNEALLRFNTNDCEVDPMITAGYDRRRGLTVRARPDRDLIARIGNFTAALKPFAPDQYFTPASDLHLTVLSIISCHEGFRYADIPGAVYLRTIRECIRHVPPMEIRFHGITASPSCLLLRGYPLTDSLDKLRNLLRRAIAEAALPNTVDGRYPARTAHITLMRFRQKPADLAPFVRFLSMNRELDFGTMTLAGLELVHNDWYHRKECTRIIEPFSLTG